MAYSKICFFVGKQFWFEKLDKNEICSLRNRGKGIDKNMKQQKKEVCTVVIISVSKQFYSIRKICSSGIGNQKFS